MLRHRRVLAALGGIAGVGALLAVAPPAERGFAMVAADHELASQAGAEILGRGGNAVDAAVAAALSAGVVQPAGSGLGGGGFAVGVLGGERFAFDFREVAPAAATRDMYVVDGQVVRDKSRTGGLAVAVPGEPRGLGELVSERGRLSHRTVAAPAIRQATRGFTVGPHLAKALDRTSFEGVRGAFEVAGRLSRTGERVRRPDLARALREWASTRGRGLNTGAPGRAIVRASEATGGALTLADLEAYTPRERAPLVGQYRGYTIVTMPPPSSGGVALLQMLAVLEGWDLPELGHNSSDYVHLLTEVMKHAYADRARHLGDPDYVEVPVDELLSDDRISEIGRKIWPTRTFDTEYYGERLAPPRDAGTQHISVTDREGHAVALTTTINTSFGSGVVVPQYGMILNNEMDDFAAAPGVPNAFGLVGGEANAIEAGKRPLSSMTPTIVLDAEGRVVLTVGASGGSTIISSTLQVLLAVLDFGLDPQEAVAAPRLHHQWLPEKLWLEPGFSLDVQRALSARGHELVVRPGFSSVQAVARQDDAYVGGADPRKGGWPARSPSP